MAFALVNDGLKAAWWREFDAMVSRWAVPWATMAGRLFEAEGSEVVREFKRGGEQAAYAAVSDERWLRYLSRLWLSVVPAAAEYVQGNIKAARAESLFEIAARLWIRKYGAEHVVDITGTTRRQIKSTIAKAIETRRNYDEISRAIASLYDGFTPARAERIARTETHAAANFGSQEVAKRSRVPLLKEWLSTPDDRTRDAHVKANHQTVAADQPFTVNGEHLMFPGDTTLGATASNVVNCRCTVAYRTAARAAAIAGRRR